MFFYFSLMVKRTGPTNIQLRSLIDLLNKQKIPFWKAVAKELSKPSRIRRTVNLSRISRSTEPKETIIIPGKVLSSGELSHQVTIAALNFSKTALDKISKAKSISMSINELFDKNKSGKGVRIIG